MKMNMAKELAALGRMTVKQLRAKHIEVFGELNRPNRTESADPTNQTPSHQMVGRFRFVLSCRSELAGLSSGLLLTRLSAASARLVNRRTRHPERRTTPGRRGTPTSEIRP